MIKINLRPRNDEFRKWTYTLALLLIAFLVGTFSQASELILNGAPIGDAYPAVYAIRMSVPASISTKGGTLCTGFLVEPRLILTAAHCLQGITGITALTNAGDVGDSLDEDFQTYRADPDYFPTDEKSSDDEVARAGAADIGYIVLKNAVSHVEPLPVVVSDTDADLKALVGQEVTLVGYGTSIWQSSGKYDGSDAGKKLKGVKSIARVANGFFELDGKKNGALPGDSGGPMLMVRDGVTKAVAINHMKSDNTRTVMRRKGIFSKIMVPVVEHLSYRASLETPLTTKNLCWVVKNSGIPIRGVECTESTDPAEAAK